MDITINVPEKSHYPDLTSDDCNSIKDMFLNIFSFTIERVEEVFCLHARSLNNLLSLPRIELTPKENIGVKYYYDLNISISQQEIYYYEELISNSIFDENMELICTNTELFVEKGRNIVIEVSLCIVGNCSDIINRCIESIRKKYFINDVIIVDSVEDYVNYMFVIKKDVHRLINLKIYSPVYHPFPILSKEEIEERIDANGNRYELRYDGLYLNSKKIKLRKYIGTDRPINTEHLIDVIENKIK